MKSHAQGKKPFKINDRQRSALRLFWRDGRLSRSDLHEKTGINPNAIGADMIALLREEIVRELPTAPDRRGRPRVPLEIDGERRQVLGIAFTPTHVEIAKLNLRGELLGEVAGVDVQTPAEGVLESCKLLRGVCTNRALGVGLSAPGFINQQSHSFAAPAPGRPEISLRPLYEAIGPAIPITLENNMHAVAARWMLTHEGESNEDVLLVGIGDGRMGAAVLVDGRPIRGSASGSNELGHTRFFTETELCYCGHTGCMERICSTAHLHRLGPVGGTLLERAAIMDPADAPLNRILDFLAMSLANAVNFLRPHRLVITGELARISACNEKLKALLEERLLSELVAAVAVDFWSQPPTRSAETAGWLALATLYREGWIRMRNPADTGKRAGVETQPNA